MNKDFESQLRTRMEGYEVAPPDDLWQRIEGKVADDSRLLSKEETARRRTIVPLRRWMAAAVALLLVVGGAVLMFQRQEEKTAAHVETTGVMGVAQKLTPTEPPLPILNIAREDVVVLDKSHPLPSQTNLVEVQDSMPRGVETLDSVPPAIRPDVQTITVKTEPKPSDRQPMPDPNIHQEHWNHDMRLLASVNVGSMMGGASTSVSPVYMSDELYDNFKNAEMNTTPKTRMSNNVALVGYEEEREYLFPVQFGLSVSYRLTDRWALQTGVNYLSQRTKLTQKMKDYRLETQYRYEYIGVPLGATYRLLDVGTWLSLYATAGVEADFNYKAKAKLDNVERDIRKDRPQFSAKAAMGAQLNLPWHFGLFVEPGVVFYFDNGSSADTRMKDQPLNGSLTMGFRYAIR